MRSSSLFRSAAAVAPLLLSIGMVFAIVDTAGAESEPPSMRIQRGITTSVSPHVHVIPSNGRPGVPNVGIIVGSRAVLVIDTGLGTANGRTVLEETRRLAGDRRIYTAATHFHPEHLGGEGAFPPSAILLRTSRQQDEIRSTGDQLIDSFRFRSVDNRALLDGFAFRRADILADGDFRLDLGGVTVDMIQAGPAHTEGDLAFFIREDGVLFTGDVVQQDYAPILMGAHSTIRSWLDRVGRLEKLPARILVPSHSAVTDRNAFADMREMLVYLGDRWAEIRRSAAVPDAARATLIADFKRRFPRCNNAPLVAYSIPRLNAGL